MHTGRQIAELLQMQPHTAADLARHFGCTQQAMRYHLRQMPGVKCERVQIIDHNGRKRMARAYWL